MPETTERDALRLSADDNVVTVLRPAGADEMLRLGEGATIRTREAIPLCHKVALARIEAGAPVVKYGQPIGLATVTIEPGRHVHVHNMRSARARADAGDD